MPSQDTHSRADSRKAHAESRQAHIDGRTARWAGQHQRRRDEFVDAALAAIARYGADASSRQIAEEAGVARTRLYKHFSDSGDLHRAVAGRAAELVTAALEPVWSPQGSPLDMITTGVDAYLRWLTANSELYRYLDRHVHMLTGGPDDPEAVPDIKTAIGDHLARLFTRYMTAIDSDARHAEPLAFGIVGFVDTATLRWLDNPGELTQDELTAQLARWIWSVLDESLQARGIRLDPQSPVDLITPVDPRPAEND